MKYNNFVQFDNLCYFVLLSGRQMVLSVGYHASFTGQAGGCLAGLIQCGASDTIGFYLHHSFGESKNWENGIHYCGTIIKVA
jgi:hypothetical protein